MKMYGKAVKRREEIKVFLGFFLGFLSGKFRAARFQCLL